MAIFTGAGVAIVTPFHADGSVNYEKLDQLIDYHCENGTDSIIICGTTGESATMTEKEHIEVIKHTIDHTKKRIPVIAGTGSNSTHTAIELSKEAAEYGADGLLIVTPYYNKATQEGLYEHYKAVAKEAKAPIIMYSVASRTGCNIESSTVARLVKDVDNIVAIKEASGNISQVADIMQKTDGNVDLYSGNDDQIVPVVSLGGNVQTFGKKPDGTPFMVGITDPSDGTSLLGTIQVGEKAVITSGSYQRYFEKDGKVYHHIIDKRTGAPAQSDLTSVTVVGEDGATADSLATALFVMGKERAVQYAASHPEIQLVLVDTESGIWTSEGLEMEENSES